MPPSIEGAASDIRTDTNPATTDGEQELLSDTDTAAESQSQASDFKLGTLTIGRKITTVIVIGLVSLGAVSGASLYQMDKIRSEIVSIAEQDIPLTDIVTKITVHQLEQAISFEKGIRHGETMANDQARAESFEKSIQRFDKLSAKVNQEIIDAKALAGKAIQHAQTEKKENKFSRVLDVLKKIEAQHKTYEEHVHSAFVFLKNRDLNGAWTLTGKIQKEEHALTKDMEELLFRIENSTAASARAAEQHEIMAVKMILIISIVGAVLAIALGTMIVCMTILKPLRQTTSTILELEEGNYSVDIPIRSRDELGGVLNALRKFRDKMGESETNRLAAEEKERQMMEAQREAEKAQRESEEKAEAARRQAEEESARKRKEELLELANLFESEVGSVVQEISGASGELTESAKGLQSAADETSSQSSAVAAASEETTTSVQTVASAAEELSASIQEISRQVTDSATTAKNAVAEAETANERVQGLEEAARKIGEVVELINDIASQTNLLALNATIEAARAGEAGKGFAVVATEVKSLADQTAKATDEIAGQITAIQEATGEAVTAITSIGGTIRTVDEISAAIAAAVEEQGSSTQEISQNISQVSAAADEVNTNINAVSQASGTTGAAASQVASSAEMLNSEADRLNEAVDQFLQRVRAA